MTEPTPIERAIEYCHDHEDDEAFRAITQPEMCAPSPEGLSHRPLPDLTQPHEQDRALAYLITLQDSAIATTPPQGRGIEKARLLAAIHNTLYALWTAPKGSPLGAPGDDPSDYRGSPWDSDIPADDRDQPGAGCDDYACPLHDCGCIGEPCPEGHHDTN